jgi:hypothetical protein
MFWFVIRDAAGEILEVTRCSDEASAQEERMQKAVKAWQDRGDQAVQLDHLKYRMTSFDGNVRVLSIEPDSPELR